MRPPPHPKDFAPARESIRGQLEWQFWAELAYRHELRATGWEPDPGEPEFDRDITKDRCRCCGRLRGSIEVELVLGGERVTFEEVPDPCLGLLPGVGQACCGHGRYGGSVYIIARGVGELKGPAAAQKMRELGGNPPRQAFLLDPIDGSGISDLGA